MKSQIAKILTGLAALMAAGITSQAQYVFTELEYPGVPFGSTYANGIDAANIVGAYWDASNVSHGFLYNATNWSTLDARGASLRLWPRHYPRSDRGHEHCWFLYG